MKKFYLLSLALITAFAISSCSKDDTPGTGNNDGGGGNGGPAPVAQSQQAVVFYLSGVWCGPCGYYGKPALKDNLDANGDDMVVISCQLSSQGYADPFNNPDANKLAQVWGVSGVPTAAVGGGESPATKIGGGSKMSSSMDTKIKSVVGTEAVVNSRITKNIEGNEMTIKVENKFFKDTDGEYYISAYVLEDNLIDKQYVSGSGWQDPAEFDNILRKALEPGQGYGVMLTSGNIKAGTELEKEYSVTLDSKWNPDNIKVAVVVWKKGSNGLLISNGVVN